MDYFKWFSKKPHSTNCFLLLILLFFLVMNLFMDFCHSTVEGKKETISQFLSPNCQLISFVPIFINAVIISPFLTGIRFILCSFVFILAVIFENDFLLFIFSPKEFYFRESFKNFHFKIIITHITLIQQLLEISIKDFVIERGVVGAL